MRKGGGGKRERKEDEREGRRGRSGGKQFKQVDDWDQGIKLTLENKEEKGEREKGRLKKGK